MLFALALASAPIWFVDYVVMTPGGTDMAKTLKYRIGRGAFLTKAECDAAGKEGVKYYTKHMVPELVMKPGWKVKYGCKLEVPKLKSAAELDAIHSGHQH